MAVKNLVEKFKKAGLVLRLLDKPMSVGAGMDQIVQLDIKRGGKGSRRTEWFEIYPGNEINRIEVLNVDLQSKQLVLFVDEPRREFEFKRDAMTNGAAKNLKRMLDENGASYRQVGNIFYIKEKTTGNKRHFLMGVDERQLFIAELRKPKSTVDEARKSLGSTVQFAEGKRNMTPGRQGEWFFVKASREQEEEIENLISKNRVVVQYKKSIGEVHRTRNSGNPHVADEIVSIPSRWLSLPKGRDFPIRGRQVFIRGCIRHVDHKTVKYSRWHEVIANHEGNTSSGGSSGITWID